MPDRKLYLGDNLILLHDQVADESVDLTYVDPPFNSQASYQLSVSAPARKGFRGGISSNSRGNSKEKNGSGHAFCDQWTWNAGAQMAFERMTADGSRLARALQACQALLGPGPRLAHLCMMAPRLRELHRVLKPTGSLYLHCDSSASHYLKLLLDTLFGPDQFRNEIIWRRTGAHGPRRSFGPVHDTLFFYTKTADYFFNLVRRPYPRGHVSRRYRGDGSGRLRFASGGNVLTGAGATDGESGLPWRGFAPAQKNRHWAIPRFLACQMPAGFDQLGILARLDALYAAGLIEIRPGAAWPTPVRYLEPADGQPLSDLWVYQPYTGGTLHGTEAGIDADVAWLGPTDPERLGYPTQKPAGLIERILRSSCPQGGSVLDSFCGSGTSLLVAERLHCSWIGIDNSAAALDFTQRRLRDGFAFEPGRDYHYQILDEASGERGRRT
jgi:site-specific DNA-methyltransferase (adenine-specific)